MTGAPELGLDAEALEDTLAPFGHSRMLPGAAYTSDGVFAWELEHLFARSWVCVGHASAFEQHTSAMPMWAAGDTVVLARDGGTVCAFYNVCRHRGHRLVEGPTDAAVLRCPYHAWVYRLDGGLRHAPGFLELDGFDPQAHGLTPVRLERWHGWLFVNLSGDAPPLAEHVGDLEQLVAPYRGEALTVAARHDYEVAANWKTITENYHECYHCPSIHPELCRVSPPDSSVNVDGDGAWIGGAMDLGDGAETMSLTGTSGGETMTWLDEGRRRQVHYYGVLPNLLLSLHPDYVMTHRLEPLACDRTRIVCEWLFPRELVARHGFDPSYASDFWDVTNRQDWHACEQVQRGMCSRGFVPGPLSPREDAVYRFVTFVARSYLDGHAATPAQLDREL
jgi:Rieske 2Fe-2S family protein